MLTKEKIEGLAPDKSSLDAAAKLAKATGWPLLAMDAGRSLAWGECQGSGATPYRVSVSINDVGYKCTCPSRKFPCKHVLAVLYMGADQPGRFTTAEPPDWVRDWLARRRKTSAAPANLEPVAQREGNSTATPAAAPPPVEPKDLAKLEAQRKRQREAREAKIDEGLLDFDHWLLDQLKAGLGDFAQVGSERCRTAARRLADAQASGLASLIDQIPGDLLKVRPEQRSDFVIEQLGLAHLLAEAYRKQALLPEPLRADIRRHIGWSQKRDEVLADPAAKHIIANWMVVGTRSILQADALRRLETWLINRDRATDHKFAVLIDYVPASAGPTGSSFMAGEEINAEVVFYPSAEPLRAVLAEHKLVAERGEVLKDMKPMSAALERWDNALAAQPFISEWPMDIGNVRIATTNDNRLVMTADGFALPLAEFQQDNSLPLAGFGALDAVGLWNGKTFSLLLAETPLGRWVSP